jgi:hypothetical protein
MVLYARNEDVLHAEVNGEIIVMNPETMDYFEFEGAAPRIWELLGNGPHSVNSLVALLTEEFEIDPANCALSVETFLTSAVENGVVVVHAESLE